MVNLTIAEIVLVCLLIGNHWKGNEWHRITPNSFHMSLFLMNINEQLLIKNLCSLQKSMFTQSFSGACKMNVDGVFDFWEDVRLPPGYFPPSNCEEKLVFRKGKLLYASECSFCIFFEFENFDFPPKNFELLSRKPFQGSFIFSYTLCCKFSTISRFQKKIEFFSKKIFFFFKKTYFVCFFRNVTVSFAFHGKFGWFSSEF